MALPACLAAVVLLLDVSGSVDDSHYAAQRDGTAAAFEHPQIVRAIETSEGIAVALAEFAHRVTTRVTWSVLRDEASSRHFAEEVRALGRSDNGFITALGDAIEHGRTLLGDPPCRPARSVIDISTDGFAEGGSVAPAEARDNALTAGNEINVLLFDAIADPGAAPVDAIELAEAEEWLQRNVANGFVRVARGTESYAEIFRQKLSAEIAVRAK